MNNNLLLPTSLPLSVTNFARSDSTGAPNLSKWIDPRCDGGRVFQGVACSRKFSNLRDDSSEKFVCPRQQLIESAVVKLGKSIIGGPYILVDRMKTRPYRWAHNWCRPIKD